MSLAGVCFAHGRFARQGRAGLHGRGAGAPGDACRLRPPPPKGRVDLPEVRFGRWFIPFTAVPRPKGRWPARARRISAGRRLSPASTAPKGASGLTGGPFQALVYSARGRTAPQGALACAGAAHKRRATLVACVHRPLGASGLTGGPIRALVFSSEFSTNSVIPDSIGDPRFSACSELESRAPLALRYNAASFVRSTLPPQTSTPNVSPGSGL